MIMLQAVMPFIHIAKFDRKVFQVEVTEDGKSIVPPSDWVEAKHESFYGF